MAKRDLLLSLKKPAKFTITSAPIEQDRFVIDGVPVYAAGLPSWIGCADILFQPNTRLFLGLTFQVLADKWAAIRSLCAELDPAVAHLDDLSSEIAQKRYPGEVGEACRFELTWATSGILEYEMAQLAEPYWCYKYSTNPENSAVVAVGISDIDSIASEHSLRIPERVSLPQLTLVSQ